MLELAFLSHIQLTIVAASFFFFLSLFPEVKCLSLSICMCTCYLRRVFYHNYPLDILYFFFFLGF